MLRYLFICLIVIWPLSHASALEKVSWDTDVLDIITAQGQVQTYELTLFNMPDVEGIKLHVVPELQRWVSIQPSIIEDTSVLTQELKVIVNVSHDSPLGIYNGVLQAREIKAGKSKNVLPIPLPVFLTITQAVENLPPDPGPENDVTIIGIDSDQDGVRDDIQRYILTKYYGDEAMKLTLLQAAKVNQLILAQSDDKEASRDNVALSMRVIECAMHVGGEEAWDAVDKVTALQMNTRSRSKAYDLFHQKIVGAMTVTRDFEDYYKSCDFDVNSVTGGL